MNSARKAPAPTAPARPGWSRAERSLEQHHQHDIDAQHPVSIARPKLANSSFIASASPTVVWVTPAEGFECWAAPWLAFHPSSGCWFSSISKLMCAAGHSGRSRGAAVDSERGDIADHHRPCCRDRHALQQCQILARAGRQLDEMGTCRCERLSLPGLVVVARRGDAQRVGNRREVTPRFAAFSKSAAPRVPDGPGWRWS